MGFHGIRINDSDIQEWLKSKKNQSEVTRKALRLMYQEELNKQAPKIVKGVIIG